jgi:glycerol-3-phosphate dehydrogenase
VVFQLDTSAGVEFDCECPGVVRGIRLRSTAGGDEVVLTAERVVFAAGRGNAELRTRVSLPSGMQLRPLHVALARGPGLTAFHGHCIEGAKTRVTITSARDVNGRMVWHIGGNLSEDAVTIDRDALIRRAQEELAATLPAVDLVDTEWTTYRIDRAEGATSSGGRPDRFTLLQEGNVLTAWPTKLVLVPRLAAAVADVVAQSSPQPLLNEDVLRTWTHPRPAATFWDRPQIWTPYSGGR